jgi:hypothetical protein
VNSNTMCDAPFNSLVVFHADKYLCHVNMERLESIVKCALEVTRYSICSNKFSMFLKNNLWYCATFSWRNA